MQSMEGMGEGGSQVELIFRNCQDLKLDAASIFHQ